MHAKRDDPINVGCPVRRTRYEPDDISPRVAGFQVDSAGPHEQPCQTQVAVSVQRKDNLFQATNGVNVTDRRQRYAVRTVCLDCFTHYFLSCEAAGGKVSVSPPCAARLLAAFL